MSLRTCSEPFAVVFVCTGNRARSPLACALFERYADVDVRASSVGTLDVVGAPALPEAVAAASRLGVDLSQHASRALRDADLSDADLVLGFEPQHVAAAVVDGGAEIGRTFLLGELPSLLEGPVTTDEDPCAGARFAVSVADSRRVRMRPDAARAIADPFGRPASEMERTAEEIDRLVRDAVAHLFGSVPVPEAS
jgi:protein-tyrosine-phosphatase